MSISDALYLGNVERETFPAKECLPLYLGSGTCGACFDGYGLMQEQTCAAAWPDGSRITDATRFMHQDHYIHGKFGMDFWLGLYQLKFAQLPIIDKKEDYEQELDLYTGNLSTNYVLQDGTSVSLSASFHPYMRDVLGLTLIYDGEMPDILLCPVTEVKGSYNQVWHPTATPTDNGFLVDTGTVVTKIKITTVSEGGKISLLQKEDGLHLHFSGDFGRHLLLIGAGNEKRFAEVETQLAAPRAVDDWYDMSTAGWQKRYGEAYVNIPDEFAQKMWARSLYYVLCSFAPDNSQPSAPMGWSGYGWRFHFPQDVSYIVPALLRLGHVDICRSIVERYARSLEVSAKDSARIYGGRGVMWAWEFPIGDHGNMFPDGEGAPNACQYEIHNAAYPARMAYETALYLKDPDFTIHAALPVIRASAEFYASHLFKEGTHWSLLVTPSMSQDEFAEPNCKNYLCALYAARYTFWICSRLGMHDYDEYLEDGLAFDNLLDKETGLYRTSEGMPHDAWGREKHPVQLNPLIFLPAENLAETEVNAYEKRAFICTDSQKNVYHGWTLATFWLAASHMHDANELYRELHRADDKTYQDPEGLSFLESSHCPEVPYYVTTHGLYLQAVNDAFVCDYDYNEETAVESAVPAQWKGAEYHGLIDRFGNTYEGTI